MRWIHRVETASAIDLPLLMAIKTFTHNHLLGRVQLPTQSRPWIVLTAVLSVHYLLSVNLLRAKILSNKRLSAASLSQFNLTQVGYWTDSLSSPRHLHMVNFPIQNQKLTTEILGRRQGNVCVSHSISTHLVCVHKLLISIRLDLDHEAFASTLDQACDSPQ